MNIELNEEIAEIEIKVSDNGIGIESSEINRVFERFYVVDKSRSNKTGTGLGLSLVKNITLYHKVKVDLKSELGQGSIFIITLHKLVEENY